MRAFAVIAVVAASIMANVAAAQLIEPPSSDPVASEPSSAPATAPALDPAAEHLLDLLQQAGVTHHTITADLRYELEETAFGDTESRDGQVYYQSPGDDQPGKFRIHFNTKQASGGPKVKEEDDYAFTGTWFIMRKPKVKQQVEYQWARPGEKIEPFKLGQGPFPVPFGQKKEDVLQMFDAATQPARSGPRGTGYLLLTAKPGTEMDISRLQMWIMLEGPLAGLPAKIISENPKQQQITTVTFSNIQSNQPLARDIFELPRPPRDWEYRREPLREGTRIQP